MTELTVKTTDGKEVIIDSNQLADQDLPKPTQKVNIDDSFLSKLEVALTLSNKVIYGLFIFWMVITGIGVIVSVLGTITYDTGNGSVVLFNLNADGAMQVSTMIFPIISSLVTLLLGYTIGSRKSQS